MVATGIDDDRIADKLLDQLLRQDIKTFVSSITHYLFDKKSGKVPAPVLYKAVHSASVQLLGETMISTDEDDWIVVRTLLEGAPSQMISQDAQVAKALLIPVKLMLEFCTRSGDLDKIKEYYERSNIFDTWPLINPCLWPSIADSFMISDQMSQSILEEVESAAQYTSKSNLFAHRIKSGLNHFLEKIKSGKFKCPVEQFHETFVESLVNAWDLVDLELYLSAYPEELFLVPGTPRRYKTSFARKIAVACVKNYVRAYQASRKRGQMGKQTTNVPNVPVPRRERVIDCIIAGNLDITESSVFHESDSDIRVFWSLLRKAWLTTVLRSEQLNVFEIYDHVRRDETLVNMFFLDQVDKGNTEIYSQLMVWNEALRSKQAYKHEIVDEPPVPMLMSALSSGSFDKRPTSVALSPMFSDMFGPFKSSGFVLPYEINAEFASGDCSFESISGHNVFVVDRPALLGPMNAYLESLPPGSVAAVDFFYKAWCDVLLERPSPAVIGIATDECVFVVLFDRILNAWNAPESAVVAGLISFFENQNVLKLFGGLQQSKLVVMSSLVCSGARPSGHHQPTSPFDLASPVCPFGEFMNLKISPVFDVSTIPPLDVDSNSETTSVATFASLVKQYLEVDVCDFEEYSNWGNSFLRNSQLHFVASKVWLMVKLFRCAVAVCPKTNTTQSVNMRKFGRSGMIVPNENQTLNSFTSENEELTIEFFSLMEDTQNILRQNIWNDLIDGQRDRSGGEADMRENVLNESDMLLWD